MQSPVAKGGYFRQRGDHAPCCVKAESEVNLRLQEHAHLITVAGYRRCNLAEIGVGCGQSEVLGRNINYVQVVCGALSYNLIGLRILRLCAIFCADDNIVTRKNFD